MSKENLSRQVTPFVAGISLIDDFYNAFAIELDSLKTTDADLLNQLFIDTATWGLSYWETFMGIATDETKTNEYRRGVIKSKILASKTLTKQALRDIFALYGLSVTYFIENKTQNYVEIFTDKKLNDREDKDLQSTLKLVFPAHLQLVINYKQTLQQASVTDTEFGSKVVLTPDQTKLCSVYAVSLNGNGVLKFKVYDADTLSKIFDVTYLNAPNPTYTPIVKGIAADNDTLYIYVQYTSANGLTYYGYQYIKINLSTGAGIYMVPTLETLGAESQITQMHYNQYDDYIYITHCGTQQLIKRVNKTNLSLEASLTVPIVALESGQDYDNSVLPTSGYFVKSEVVGDSKYICMTRIKASSGSAGIKGDLKVINLADLTVDTVPVDPRAPGSVPSVNTFVKNARVANSWDRSPHVESIEFGLPIEICGNYNDAGTFLGYTANYITLDPDDYSVLSFYTMPAGALSGAYYILSNKLQIYGSFVLDPNNGWVAFAGSKKYVGRVSLPYTRSAGAQTFESYYEASTANFYQGVAGSVYMYRSTISELSKTYTNAYTKFQLWR